MQFEVGLAPQHAVAGANATALEVREDAFALTRDQRPSTVTMAELHSRLAAAHARLESLRVRYRARLQSRGVAVEGQDYVLRTVAAKGEMRRLETAHAGPGQDAAEDPTRSVTIFSGKAFCAYYPFSRLYETSRKVSHPSTLKARAEPYLESLGWRPPTDESMPPVLSDRPFFITEVLRKERCRVLGRQESFDGRWCNVLEVAGLERMWLVSVAPADQASLAKGNRPPLKTLRPGPLLCYVLGATEKVAGFWLPKWPAFSLPLTGSTRTRHVWLQGNASTEKAI